MRILLASVLMALGSFASAAEGQPFACNMKALTKAERATYQKLTRELWASVTERRELSDGYAFRSPAEELMTAARWVSFERKCCPFFTFEIEVGGNGGPLWLRVTGAKGIKAFIREEFQLDS
jgi:hypothetical protein